MKGTTRVLGFLVIVCVSALIVLGATYALFTGGSTVNNHLKAGNLTVGLSRTAFTEYSLNEKGLMEEKTDGVPVDLTKDAAPVFDIKHAVPHCWYQAEVTVSNDGSVAFEHSARILWDEEGASDGEKLFASQIEITLFYGEEQKSFLLTECNETENEIALGVLLKGEQKSFKVKAAFLNVENNNGAQGVAIEFDLQVSATQYVSE